MNVHSSESYVVSADTIVGQCQKVIAFKHCHSWDAIGDSVS